MQSSVVVVTVAEMIVLGCTGILTYLAYQAYRRTGSTSLRTLTLGLGLVATGTLAGGLLHQFGSFDFGACIGIESSLSAAGFLVVLYALYVGDAGGGVTP
ncbi:MULTISPECIES: hypothetical protein [unclassified Halorhabdus]|uniref:DUF7521 family protein n=1 Tax=unclassified Halorhabdus TaxID=2621901 RepID=UPI0023DAE2A8|nr:MULTISPECIES: hypothetical protein [unclassified Halorhabdus]WEL17035.1 putative membrane protein [Halorhabdus sp. SVX81]WEL20919.1 putative membrane protein [Halorhabdus sp. BNX81]